VLVRFGCVTLVDVDPNQSEQDVRPALPLPFDEFFAAPHAEMVRALTLSMGDVELGRDAAAEGFARALERWSSVSGYANPSGWVYRVGLNWARSGRRKRRRERTGMRLTDHAAPEATAHDSQLSTHSGTCRSSTAPWWSVVTTSTFPKPNSPTRSTWRPAPSRAVPAERSPNSRT